MNNTKKEFQKCKIAFIGMMGSGKTTIAKAFDKNAFDLDEKFIEVHKIPIADFFKKYGENTFRDEEEKILKEISKKDSFTISCGGGIILREKNREILFNKDIYTIYLKASIDTIFERIKNDTSRPLLLVKDPKKEIKDILEKRKKYYQMAHLKISVDNKSIDEIVDEIYENNI